MLLDKLDDQVTREFYARRAADEGWSREFLGAQIHLRLHERVGAAPNTFDRTIPPAQREGVKQILRDPYILDFLGELDGVQERDLEDRILLHLERFLLALGVGFAFVGRQYRLAVGSQEFFLDLLFYHLGLSRYVVIELKIDQFKPEHAGKLAFYIAAVDRLLRRPERDDPTIGILLTKNRDKVVVEFSLESIDSPVAVSNWSALPSNVRAELPSAEQFAGAISAALEDESPSS